ncbi:MAG: chromosomal replication initiator DnaA, partial [Pseudomonadota bacterium]
MSQRQATFELPHRPALGREDFMVSPSNAQAVALIEQWQRWPQNRMALVGPARAGKTHLAQVWCRISGAGPARAEGPPAPVLVEDADRVAGHRDGEERL